ncbi:MAG: carbohydrate kinase family protein [Minisyncoccia bacterium]
MIDVFAIGSTTFDNFLEIDSKTMFWDKVPSQKALVFPFGEKIEIKNIYSFIGGNSANASITFSRQGFKTGCVAKIGKDIWADFILKKLIAEKVNIKFILQEKNIQTAYSILLLQNGERTILSYHGASNYLKLNDLNLNQLKSKWWYVSLSGQSYKIFNSLVNFAYKNNIALAFNPSGFHLIKDKESILKNLEKISVLILNEEEASVLTGISWQKEKEVFKKLDKLMPGILIVTGGKKGATISDGKYVYRSGIFKEKKLIDRTGAGDAYGSGFISGLMHKNIGFKNIGDIKPEDVLYAIKLAAANSTAVIEHIGASVGSLTFNQFKQEKRFKNLKVKIEKI